MGHPWPRIHSPILGWLMNSGDLQLQVSPMHAARPPAAAGTLSRASTTNHFPLVAVSLDGGFLYVCPQHPPASSASSDCSCLVDFAQPWWAYPILFLDCCSWLFSSHSLPSFSPVVVPRGRPILPPHLPSTAYPRLRSLPVQIQRRRHILFETRLCEPDLSIDLP